jgi:hypothetical protein
MSTEKKKKRETLTSPVGTAVFPYLNEPDTKFDARGTYTTKLKAVLEESQPLIDRLNAEHAKSVAAAKAENPKKAKKIKDGPLPYEMETDEEGNETGNVLLKFKLIAQGTRADKTTFTQKPALFDAKGKPLPQGKKVGGGSRIKVAFEINPYFTDIAGAGISLRLRAVQVLELKEWGNRDAAAFGFGQEEGYSADDDAAATFPENASESTTTESSGTDNDDF